MNPRIRNNLVGYGQLFIILSLLVVMFFKEPSTVKIEEELKSVNQRLDKLLNAHSRILASSDDKSDKSNRGNPNNGNNGNSGSNGNAKGGIPDNSNSNDNGGNDPNSKVCTQLNTTIS